MKSLGWAVIQYDYVLITKTQIETQWKDGHEDKAEMEIMLTHAKEHL